MISCDAKGVLEDCLQGDENKRLWIVISALSKPELWLDGILR